MEFNGDVDHLSFINNTANQVTLDNGLSYTARFYAKGSGTIQVIFQTDTAFWNFNLNQWDAGVNPFGPDYSYTASLSTDYSEFVVPSVIGNGEPANILFGSLNSGPVLDSLTFSQNDDGNNLFVDASFESWETFPSDWDYYRGQVDGILEIEDDPTYVYGGSYSMKLGNGPSGGNSMEISTGITGVVSNSDISFFAMSSDLSPIKQMDVWVRTSDHSYYYNPSSLVWESNHNYPAASFSLTDSFQEYSIEDIPPSPDGTLKATFYPGWVPDAFAWVDSVCISASN